MTFYMNNQPELNNKIINSNTKGLIDNNNENKKLNYKGNHIESTIQNNIQIPFNFYNNDNYDFDINYNNNNSYYRSETCIENKQQQQQQQFNFINNNKNILKTNINHTNEIFISSSSDNDNDKIDFEDDCETENMNFSKIKQELLATAISSVPTKEPQQEMVNLNDYFNVLFSTSSISKFELLSCKYISKLFNYYGRHKFNEFEDLQKFFILLRKTLNKIKIKQEFDETYAKQANINNNFLAFDNLTYSSSIEDLAENNPLNAKKQKPQQQLLANDVLSKKTIKSIKRKDKLKKETKVISNENTSIIVSDNTRHNSRSRQPKKQNQVTETVPVVEIHDELTLSNKEFEKQLKRKYRCKSVARSIRRAKSVFYRNRRSKSLESLSALALADLKLKFPEENEEVLNKLANSRANSIMSSCSSFTSAASLASDISSSYFHELSEWSPNFSDSDSADSNSISLDDIDWEANLSLSEYCSSSDSEYEDEDENDLECDCNYCNIKNNSLKEDSIQANLTFQILENLQSKVISQMLNLHPFFDKSICVAASSEFITELAIFKITSKYLTENNHDCSICLASFEYQEEVSYLPCSHLFHLICLKSWLSKMSTCPICKCNYKNNVNNLQINSRETLI